MNPSQTKRRMAVMARHGEPGWRIELKTPNGIHWNTVGDPEWSNPHGKYRAVRVETTAGKRVPLAWSTIRCGMVVRRENETMKRLVDTINDSYSRFWAGRGSEVEFMPDDLTRTHYLDGETWKPLWTEEPGEERIVEIVSEEEV